MIDKDFHIKEIYTLKHINDSDKKEKEYSKNFFSPMMFNNKNMNEFISKLEIPITWLIESPLILRNFWNYTVDSYYNKHKN